MSNSGRGHSSDGLAGAPAMPDDVAMPTTTRTAPENDTAVPVIEVSDRDGECPECGHETVDEETALDRWIRQTWRKVTRRKPKPARCGYQPWDYDWETSDGPQCACRHPFHGS